MKIASALSLALLAMTACASFDGLSEECGERCDTIVEFPNITDKPDSVLFIPLSSGYVGMSEREWQSDDAEFDRAIREMTRFYTNRGVETVMTLPRSETWEDLQAHLLDLDGQQFDRVLMVSHGALDGPMTRGSFSKEISEDSLVERWNVQPGLVKVKTISFPPNSDVAQYVANKSEMIESSYDTVVDSLLEFVPETDRESQNECFRTRVAELRDACGPSCVTTCQQEGQDELYANCFEGCYNQCVDDASEIAQNECIPLAVSVEEIVDRERFDAFVLPLQSVIADDGLLFMGHCNAATNTGLHFGSVHHLGDTATNFVDLMAEQVERHVAGPVGKTSGQDIINRVSAMERKIDQKYLYISAPPKSDETRPDENPGDETPEPEAE